MEFLYFLEGLRTPLWNEILQIITYLGEETAFLVTALVVFWCVDKKKGYYVMCVGFLGTMLNQYMKLLCRVPRPWVADPSFTIVGTAKEAAAGYSFPSGHSQSAVGTFGSLAAVTKTKWLRWLFIAVCVLVPFSRMYLGVHYPADVLTGSAMALLLIVALRPMAQRENRRGMQDVIAMMVVLAFGLLLFALWFPTVAEVDEHNAASCLKNGWTMVGCLLGVAAVYPLERKLVNFETKAVWWAQILKVLLGLALVLAVKEGLRTPLELVLSTYPARAVRYFLIVLTAGFLWPMSFRYFSQLGVKK